MSHGSVGWHRAKNRLRDKTGFGMYYRLQKSVNTFLCESSRQVGSTSRRPPGDAVAGG